MKVIGKIFYFLNILLNLSMIYFGSKSVFRNFKISISNDHSISNYLSEISDFVVFVNVIMFLIMYCVILVELIIRSDAFKNKELSQISKKIMIGFLSLMIISVIIFIILKLLSYIL